MTDGSGDGRRRAADASVLVAGGASGRTATLGTALERAADGLDVEAVAAGALVDRLDDGVGCVVSAAETGGPSGLELLRAVRETRPALPFVLAADGEGDGAAGQGADGLVEAAVAAGATDVVRLDGDARVELLARRVADAVAARGAGRGGGNGVGSGTASRRKGGAENASDRPPRTDRSARAELERSRAKFRALIENSPAVVSVLDAAGRFEYVSPASESVTGYEPREVIGDVAFDYVHPADREKTVREFERAVTDPSHTPVVEHRFRHADGRWITMESRGRNRLEDPDVEGFVVNTRDVTRYKQVEQRLRGERDLTERIFEVSPYPLVVLDRDGVVRRVNDRFDAQVAMDREEILGTGSGDAEFTVLDDEGAALDGRETLTGRVLASGEAVQDEAYRIRTPDGDEYRVTASGAPITVDGGVSHAVLAFHEIELV